LILSLMELLCRPRIRIFLIDSQNDWHPSGLINRLQVNKTQKR
jgi:hypothetical protein